MAAQPGDRDYGRLTIMLAPSFEVQRLFDVGPGAFQPPPKVWSAVVRIRTRPAPLFAVSPHFAALVAAAFSQRRKTLRNALSAFVTLAQIERRRHRSRSAARDAHPGAIQRTRADVSTARSREASLCQRR